MSETLVHTVLLVDDDPWILAAASKILAAEGCRVLTTTEPLQALPTIEWEGVDVIVADISMPSIDGVDLLKRTRELFPDVVRILLSGAASLDRALRAINEVEVFRFLTKPVEETELRKAVAGAVRRRQALRAIAARERASAIREAALRELEGRSPGLAMVALEEGVYVVPDAGVQDALARVGDEAAARFIRGVLAGRSADDGTKPL